jgi:hypothetical protein
VISEGGLRSWLLTLIAIPLGLQGLASLDERLEFGPLLERALLNYDKVIEAFWRFVGYHLGFDAIGVEGVLTFYLMLLLACLYAALGKNVFSTVHASHHGASYILEIGCQALLLTLLIGAFSHGVFTALAIFSIFICGFHVASRRWRENPLSPLGAFLSVSFVIVFVFLLALFVPRPWVGASNPLIDPLSGGLAIAVGIVNNAVGVDKQIFSRGTVAAVGVYAIDACHRVLIPHLEMLLRGADVT